MSAVEGLGLFGALGLGVAGRGRFDTRTAKGLGFRV